MINYFYDGPLSSSKSLFNRSLIVQSYFPSLQLSGFSQSEDIDHLKLALKDMQNGKDSFHAGDGGTTFRFLVFRLSREVGNFKIFLSESLKKRPHHALIKTLNSLGVEISEENDHFSLRSKGWVAPPQVLAVDASQSSQFASALLLNAWNLPFDLNFSYPQGALSESYFQMTLNLVRQMGMLVVENSGVYTVPKNQKINVQSWDVEMDISSAFTLSCFAAAGEPLRLRNFPFDSLQPDLVFLKIFKQMNIPWNKSDRDLLVFPSESRKPIDVNLAQCPDLFPMLAALCAVTEGSSFLRGAGQLVHKESNRLVKTLELLMSCGVHVEQIQDGLHIQGASVDRRVLAMTAAVEFDPSQDHRMAMAAGLFKLLGYPIRIKNPNVVNKSFSDFWSLVRIDP